MQGSIASSCCKSHLQKSHVVCDLANDTIRVVLHSGPAARRRVQTPTVPPCPAGLMPGECERFLKLRPQKIRYRVQRPYFKDLFWYRGH